MRGFLGSLPRSGQCIEILTETWNPTLQCHLRCCHPGLTVILSLSHKTGVSLVLCVLRIKASLFLGPRSSISSDLACRLPAAHSVPASRGPWVPPASSPASAGSTPLSPPGELHGDVLTSCQACWTHATWEACPERPVATAACPPVHHPDIFRGVLYSAPFVVRCQSPPPC